MTFTLYGTTFVDGVTVIPAAFLNKMRTELPSAVDGRGGSYTNTSLLNFTTSGAGFTIDGDSLITLSSTGGLTITSEVNGTIPYASGAVQVYVDISRAHAPSATRWVYESANPTTLTTVPTWNQQATGDDYPLLVPLDVPVGSVITDFNGRLNGAAGGLPGTLPTLSLVWHDVTSDTLTTIASATDPSASMAAYNAAHSVSLTGMSETVSSTRRYYAKLTGEAGIFSGAGLQFIGLRVGLTITEQTKFYG